MTISVCKTGQICLLGRAQIWCFGPVPEIARGGRSTCAEAGTASPFSSAARRARSVLFSSCSWEMRPCACWTPCETHPALAFDVVPAVCMICDVWLTRMNSLLYSTVHTTRAFGKAGDSDELNSGVLGWARGGGGACHAIALDCRRGAIRPA